MQMTLTDGSLHFCNLHRHTDYSVRSSLAEQKKKYDFVHHRPTIIDLLYFPGTSSGPVRGVFTIFETAIPVV